MSTNSKKGLWLIWSIEHSAWWAPDCCGYESERANAGRYSFRQALDIVSGANVSLGDVPDEAMVPDIEPADNEITTT